jgi:hypothetical protein
MKPIPAKPSILVGLDCNAESYLGFAIENLKEMTAVQAI